MDTLSAVRTVSPVIYQTGAAWFFHETTVEAGKLAGMPNGFAWYVAGRGGVLGPADPSVIAAAFGFFHPDLVAKMWTAAKAASPAADTGSLYAEACVAFGRAHFGNFAGAARLVELCRALSEAAPTMGRVLFTGWKAMPRPADAAGALELELQTLRELRGDAHIQAIAVQGLSAAEAIVAKDGAERAKQFGWSDPLPDPEPLRERRQLAEDLTDELMVAVYDRAFSADARAEFVSLVQQASAFVNPAGA